MFRFPWLFGLKSLYIVSLAQHIWACSGFYVYYKNNICETTTWFEDLFQFTLLKIALIILK